MKIGREPLYKHHRFFSKKFFLDSLLPVCFLLSVECVFSISCRKQPRRCFFSFSPALKNCPIPKQGLESHMFNSWESLQATNFTAFFQGFIFPRTSALELFFFGHHFYGFLPVRFFPAILNRSETTLSKRHVLHQFRVQHLSFAVDAVGFTPTQDLENTNKLILNPHHTFFFHVTHGFFLLSTN